MRGSPPEPSRARARAPTARPRRGRPRGPRSWRPPCARPPPRRRRAAAAQPPAAASPGRCRRSISSGWGRAGSRGGRSRDQAAGRERLGGERPARGRVGHDRVRHPRPQPELLDATGRRSVLDDRSRARRRAAGRGRRRRRPTSRGRARSSIAAAGPRRAWPATIGLTATTRSRRAATAARIPGTARIGSIEMNGLDGAITTTSAAAIASSTPGAGRAASAPSKRMPSTGSAWPRRT